MLPNWNSQAIVWTAVQPAYSETVSTQQLIPADIQTVHSWIERAIDLARIRKLEGNWDGFGADAPELTVLAGADHFFRILRERDIANPPMRIVVSPDGAIAFEWLKGNSFIRAEIEDSNEIDWMIATPGQPTEFAVEHLAEPSAFGTQQGQAWQPAPVAVDEPDYAFAR